MNIIWFSKKAEAMYGLKPEDYDIVREQDGGIRVRHKKHGGYVGYVPFDKEVTCYDHDYNLVLGGPVPDG